MKPGKECDRCRWVNKFDDRGYKTRKQKNTIQKRGRNNDYCTTY